MKKLAIFAVLLSVFVTNYGFADGAKNCRMKTCDLAGVTDAEKFYSKNGSQCYYCGSEAAGDDSCDNNIILGLRDDIATNAFSDVKQCITVTTSKTVEGGFFSRDKVVNTTTGSWKDFKPSRYCDNSPFKVANGIQVANTRVYYLTDGIPTTAKVSGDATVFLSGTTFCKMLVCKEGFVISDDKKSCVDEQEYNKKISDDLKKKQAALYKQKSDALKKKKSECDAAVATGAIWNDISNKCECNDVARLSWDEVKKQCVEKIASCSDEQKRKLLEISLKYSDVPNISDLVNIILAECKKGSSNIAQTELSQNLIKLELLIKQYDEKYKPTAADSEKSIKVSISGINSMLTDFNGSAWKTSTGKFNTTRLMSDSIAGVVLGTAGGLITSSVIKKNQTENGFEDINCSVGGQTVANWGDEFVVGIQ